MTYNVFSGTLNPTHFTSLPLGNGVGHNFGCMTAVNLVFDSRGEFFRSACPKKTLLLSELLHAGEGIGGHCLPGPWCLTAGVVGAVFPHESVLRSRKGEVHRAFFTCALCSLHCSNTLEVSKNLLQLCLKGSVLVDLPHSNCSKEDRLDEIYVYFVACNAYRRVLVHCVLLVQLIYHL